MGKEHFIPFIVSAKHGVAQRHFSSLYFNTCANCQTFTWALFWVLILSLFHLLPLLIFSALKHLCQSFSHEPKMLFSIYDLFFASLLFISLLGCKHDYLIFFKKLLLLLLILPNLVSWKMISLGDDRPNMRNTSGGNFENSFILVFLIFFFRQIRRYAE